MLQSSFSFFFLKQRLVALAPNIDFHSLLTDGVSCSLTLQRLLPLFEAQFTSPLCVSGFLLLSLRTEGRREKYWNALSNSFRSQDSVSTLALATPDQQQHSNYFIQLSKLVLREKIFFSTLARTPKNYFHDLLFLATENVFSIMRARTG